MTDALVVHEPARLEHGRLRTGRDQAGRHELSNVHRALLESSRGSVAPPPTAARDRDRRSRNVDASAWTRTKTGCWAETARSCAGEVPPRCDIVASGREAMRRPTGLTTGGEGLAYQAVERYGVGRPIGAAGPAPTGSSISSH